MGALDKSPFSIPNAVADADIVLLAVQMDAVRDLLALIAPELKSGAVVLDTAPVRADALAWASEIMSKERYYVGFTPLISALYLEENSGDTAAAKADLFREGMFAITAPNSTVDAAIKLATDLAGILGAGVLFADVLEIDSYMAATHQLPQLLAAALANVTVSRPGWSEGRKFAGRAFAQRQQRSHPILLFAVEVLVIHLFRVKLEDQRRPMGANPHERPRAVRPNSRKARKTVRQT
jgi:prephenate dehydrogenase